MLQTLDTDIDMRGTEKKSQSPLEKKQVYNALLERPDKPFMLENILKIIIIPIEL